MIQKKKILGMMDLDLIFINITACHAEYINLVRMDWYYDSWEKITVRPITNFMETNTMKQTGSMTILEHLACAMEDLNDKDFQKDPEEAKLLIEKSRALSELAARYTDVIRTDQEEKRIIIEAMNVAGKWNYDRKEFPKALGFNTEK